MKPNLMITYQSGGNEHKQNLYLNDEQVELFKECEYHGNYWASLVLGRYATNTSSKRHRAIINKILDNRHIDIDNLGYKVIGW